MAALADAAADCNQDRDNDLSIRGCTELLKRNPRNATAYYNRGTAHLGNGQVDTAIRDFTKAIEIDAKFAKAYFNRAAARTKLGDATRAAADRARALQLAPTLDKD